MEQTGQSWAQREAEVEDELRRSQKMEKRMGETMQQGWWVCGERPVCRDWPPGCKVTVARALCPGSPGSEERRTMSGFHSSQAGRPPWRNMHSRGGGRETAQQSGLVHSRNTARAMLVLGTGLACVPEGGSLGMAGMAPGLACQPEGPTPPCPS